MSDRSILVESVVRIVNIERRGKRTSRDGMFFDEISRDVKTGGARV